MKTIISFTFLTGHWYFFNLHLLLRFTSCVKSDLLLKVTLVMLITHWVLSLWQQQTFQLDFFNSSDLLGSVTEERFYTLPEIVTDNLLHS